MASTCSGFLWYGAGPPLYISVISRPGPRAITSGEVGRGRRGLGGRGVGLGACTKFGLFAGVMLRGDSGIWNDKQNQKHTPLSDHHLGLSSTQRGGDARHLPFDGLAHFHSYRYVTVGGKKSVFCRVLSWGIPTPSDAWNEEATDAKIALWQLWTTRFMTARAERRTAGVFSSVFAIPSQIWSAKYFFCVNIHRATKQSLKRKSLARFWHFQAILCLHFSSSLTAMLVKSTHHHVFCNGGCGVWGGSKSNKHINEFSPVLQSAPFSWLEHHSTVHFRSGHKIQEPKRWETLFQFERSGDFLCSQWSSLHCF